MAQEISASAENIALENRIWIDHLPKNEKDKFSVFYLVTEDEIGVFSEQSAFTGSFDLCGIITAPTKSEVGLVMLQSDKKFKLSFKVEKAEKSEFDFKTTLTNTPRGPTVYFSMEGWEIDSKSDAKTQIFKVLNSLLKR